MHLSPRSILYPCITYFLLASGDPLAGAKGFLRPYPHLTYVLPGVFPTHPIPRTRTHTHTHLSSPVPHIRDQTALSIVIFGIIVSGLTIGLRSAKVADITMLQYCQSGGTVVVVVGILILSTMPPQLLDLDEFIEKHHAVRWGISLALGGMDGLWVRTGCGGNLEKWEGEHLAHAWSRIDWTWF